MTKDVSNLTQSFMPVILAIWRSRLILKIAKTEFKFVCVLFALELISTSALVATTLIVLHHLNSSPAAVWGVFEWLETNLLTGSNLLLLALFTSTLILVAKLAQGFLDAKITGSREFSYANYLRSLPETHHFNKISNKERVKASHYFGRLTSAVLQIASSFIMLLLSYLFLFYLVGTSLIAEILILTIACAIPMLGISLLVGRHVKRSALGIVQYAGLLTRWKNGDDLKRPDDLEIYFKHYFNRIFLVGVIGVSNPIFTIVFVGFLLINSFYFNIEFNLETLVAFYFIGIFYLGLVLKFASNLVKVAAFIPFVEKFVEIENST